MSIDSEKYINVCACVLLHMGKLMLATRRPGGHLAGKWEFPGGKIASIETPEACIVREIQEELSLPITCSGELFFLDFTYPEKKIRLHFMKCQLMEKQLPIPTEHQYVAWFTAAEAFALDLATADRTALEAVQMFAQKGKQEWLQNFNQDLASDLLAFVQVPASLEHAKLPQWFHIAYGGGKERLTVQELINRGSLHTVCESAKCPNRCDCWKRKTATFMILGNICTRDCRFCAVPHGAPLPPDTEEPIRIAESVKKLGLKYAVITCVTRDDLPDGGAEIMAQTVQQIRRLSPDTKTETLCSDYRGDVAFVQRVLDALPVVFGHNLETVERLTPMVRNRADYRRSLQVLAYASQAGKALNIVTKSGIMLGLGETEDEIRQSLQDLRLAGVEIVTLGQYLRPTHNHWPVHQYISPEEFQRWKQYAENELGFRQAVAGPLVRSSYLAEEAFLAPCH